METFEVTVLGCASAKPSLTHSPSAHIVNIHNGLYLVDCGEGTQVQLRKARARFTAIKAIFITHLHGDHCFGLPGMLSTFSLLGRRTPLEVFGPPELKRWLNVHLSMFQCCVNYPIHVHAVDPRQQTVIYSDKAVSVETLPLHHRVPCCGYLFREKPGLPHIRRDMIDFYKIPHYRITDIKQGADWVTEDGRTIPQERLVVPAEPSRSYAYCSDTVYLPGLAERIKGVDLLYHEATYAHADAARAKEVFHTTAHQAALVARDAEARRLLIGHFSSRYSDFGILLDEAREIFPNALLANEMLKLML